MAKADATQTKFTVELAQIRHSPTDGTAEVRVFLKNLGVDHLHLNQVSMDGVLLSEAQLARDDTTPPSEGEAKIAVVPRAFAPFYAAAPKTKIAWAWLSSSPVPPGGVAEFRVKLLSAPARRIPMTFTSQDGVAATASVAGSDDAAYVRITMAAFSADLKKCYVYVENATPDPIDLDHVEWDGQVVAKENILAASMTLAPLAKSVFVVTHPGPTVPGATGMVGLYREYDLPVAFASVRAVNVFPMAVEGGDGRPSGVPTSSGNEPTINMLLSCPSHALGPDWSQSVKAIVERRTAAIEQEPERPTALHLCRRDITEALSFFSGMTDLLVINPNHARWRPGTGPSSETSDVEKARWLTALVRRQTTPAAFFTVAHTAPFGAEEGLDDPVAFRIRVYAVMGEGSKGVWYRRSSRGREGRVAIEDITAAIDTMSQELNALAPYLRIADVWTPTGLDAPVGYRLQCLLAGDCSAVLFLTPLTRDDDASPSPMTAPVDLKLPRAAFGLFSLAWSPRGKELQPCPLRMDGEYVYLQVRGAAQGVAILLKTEAAEL